VRTRRYVEGERGETLLELLIAIAILGISLVAIATGISVSIIATDTQRKQATASLIARGYAESIETYVANGHYAACQNPGAAAPNNYQPGTVGFSVPSGFTAAPSAATSWNASSSAWSTCSPDTGVQKITVTVSSDGRATEILDIILRKPS
jgi:prepilin-type N-terminal cleavage/methylation domain-containing protein